MKACKLGKAAGLDGMYMEFSKNMGANCEIWMKNFLSRCISSNTIPKIWRQAQVIAIPKPGKDLKSPKSHRQVSLLSVTYP